MPLDLGKPVGLSGGTSLRAKAYFYGTDGAVRGASALRVFSYKRWLPPDRKLS